MESSVLYRLIKKVILFVSFIFSICLLSKTINYMVEVSIKEYKNNIVIEVKSGQVIDSFKEVVPGILGGNIKFETAIKVDDEIIISNEKDIYYEAVS